MRVSRHVRMPTRLVGQAVRERLPHVTALQRLLRFRVIGLQRGFDPTGAKKSTVAWVPGLPLAGKWRISKGIVTIEYLNYTYDSSYMVGFEEEHQPHSSALVPAR